MYVLTIMPCTAAPAECVGGVGIGADVVQRCRAGRLTEPPSALRQVTGYVLIASVDVSRLVLPSLQIIRGRTLFKLNVLRDEDFSLMVTMSKMFSLELPALRGE